MFRRKSEKNEVTTATKRIDTDLGLNVSTFLRVLSHTSKYWGMNTAGCVYGLFKEDHQTNRSLIVSKYTLFWMRNLKYYER